ncbi:uncharacterized protein LOC144123897 [Amblyomma americanum]
MPRHTSRPRKKGAESQPKSPPTEKEAVLSVPVPEGAGVVREQRPAPTAGTAAPSGRRPPMAKGAPEYVAVPVGIAEDAGGAEGIEASAVPTGHRKRRRGVERPPELPLLRLPKFVMQWAPLRIIGLLRPQPTRQRKTPTLRQLLHEAQNREQEVLNMYTKERQRQMVVVAIIGLLCLYYAGVAGAFFYFELGEQPPATPGGRRVPLRLLRSTINSSAN